MFRTISDFLSAWKVERDSAVKVFRELTNPSLQRRVTPNGRSLGFITWHITRSLAELMNRLAWKSPRRHGSGRRVGGTLPDWVCARNCIASLVLTGRKSTAWMW
jgi:hypothetical protein